MYCLATGPSPAQCHGAILREVLSQTTKEKGEAYPSQNAVFFYKKDIVAWPLSMTRHLLIIQLANIYDLREMEILDRRVSEVQ